MSDGSEITESCKEEVMEIYRKLAEEDGQGFPDADNSESAYEGSTDNSNRYNSKQDSPPLVNKSSGISALAAIVIFVIATILCIIFICYKNRDMLYAPKQRPSKEKDKKQKGVSRR